MKFRSMLSLTTFTFSKQKSPRLMDASFILARLWGVRSAIEISIYYLHYNILILWYKKSRIQIHSASYILYIKDGSYNIHCWKWFCCSIFASWYITPKFSFYQRCLSRIWYQNVSNLMNVGQIRKLHQNIVTYPDNNRHQSCYKITRITFIEYIKYVCLQVSLVGWSCNVWFPVYIYAKMYFCFV